MADHQVAVGETGPEPVPVEILRRMTYLGTVQVRRAMKRSDITDHDVVAACAAQTLGAMSLHLLIAHTGAPAKVALAAMDRAASRGLIDYGVSLRTAWPTPAGQALLTTDPTTA